MRFSNLLCSIFFTCADLKKILHHRFIMIPEIDSAAGFLSNILRTTMSGQSVRLTNEQMCQFRQTLVSAFRHRCDGHWFPERPLKGSAYRCIRIANRSLDRDVAMAGTAAGVPESQLRSLLPSELTLWIDPDEVSYRFGEEGSVGIIYDGRSSGDSNANCVPSPSIEAPSPSKYSDVCHHDAMRISPDTVNDEYRAQNNICAHMS